MAANGSKDNERSVPILCNRRPGSKLTGHRACNPGRPWPSCRRTSRPAVALHGISMTRRCSQPRARGRDGHHGAVAFGGARVILFLATCGLRSSPIVRYPFSWVVTLCILAGLGSSLNSLVVVWPSVGRRIGLTTRSSWSKCGTQPQSRTVAARGSAQDRWTKLAVSLIAIALTLCSVVIPLGVHPGISGEFLRQFAVTITAST